MRRVIVTDSFMWDAKDKPNLFNPGGHVVECKLKFGFRYQNDSVFYSIFKTICSDIQSKINILMSSYYENDEENNIELNKKISAFIYEVEKSNLVRIVDSINEEKNLRKIIVYPSHRFKKHLSKQNEELDLKIKFREGTSNTINSDVMESIYELYNKANLYGKTLKEKSLIFVDGLNSLNNSKIYNNGVDYHIYYKLDGYNIILIGLENEFDEMLGRWLEVYEESLVSIYDRKIFITANKVSKSIKHYLSNNPTEEDLSIVKLIIQEYNASNRTKYKLHSSNHFVYIDDEFIGEKFASDVSSMYRRGAKFVKLFQVERYRQVNDNFVIMSLDRI